MTTSWRGIADSSRAIQALLGHFDPSSNSQVESEQG